jgi:hypothetical protein
MHATCKLLCVFLWNISLNLSMRSKRVICTLMVSEWVCSITKEGTFGNNQAFWIKMEGWCGRKFDILNVYALKKIKNRCRLKEVLLENV